MRLVPAVACVAASLALPSSASAAADRTAVLSAAAAKATWDGGPVTGVFGLSADDDDTLLDVQTGGTVTVALSDPSASAGDIDVDVFRSDDTGEPMGDPVAEAATLDAAETVGFEAEAGKYLVRVTGFAAAQGTYTGTATLEPAAIAPPPPAVTDAAPTARIAKASKAGFSGTAADDRGIRSVEIGVLRVKGRKCAQLNRKGRFAATKSCKAPTTFLRAKGTAKWSFRAKPALKKAGYVLYVRVTDTAGKATIAKKAFKVRK